MYVELKLNMPFEQLYNNWLQNLLVATSRNGYRNYQQKK